MSPATPSIICSSLKSLITASKTPKCHKYLVQKQSLPLQSSKCFNMVQAREIQEPAKPIAWPLYDFSVGSVLGKKKGAISWAFILYRLQIL